MANTPRGTSPARRRGGGSPLGKRGAAGADEMPPLALALRVPLLLSAPADEAAPSPQPTRAARGITALVVGVALAAAAAGGAAGIAFAGGARQQPQLAASTAPAAPATTPLPLLRPPPHVIAHRGASGLLPEHTLPAYAAALASGADYLECDVHLTADLFPICRHDPDLSTTTDAREQFPDRARRRAIDESEGGGEPAADGVFACDLTLAEVRTLKARQRWPEDRGVAHDGAYGVATLDELLALVDAWRGQGWQRGQALGQEQQPQHHHHQQPRVVGVYPETKHAAWHDREFSARWRRRDARLLAGLRALEAGNATAGLPSDSSSGGRLLERVVASRLLAAGYGGRGPVGSDAWRARPALVQSFELESLRAVAWLAEQGQKAAAAAGGTTAAAVSAVLSARLPPVLPRAQQGKNALPLVLLLGGWPGWKTADTGETLPQQLERLGRWSREVDGAGPWKELLFEVGGGGGHHHHHASAAVATTHGGDVAAAEAEAEDEQGHPALAPPKPSGLLARLKAAGLVVHAYTVRHERRFVLPGFGGSAAREMQALFGGGGNGEGGNGASAPWSSSSSLDGAFADFPAAMVGFLVGEGLRSAS